MSDTFSQIYIQVVFSPRFRQSLIGISWEEELYRYITGIVQNKKQLLIAINGMPDHIHILFGMKPDCCISDLVREIKKSSTEFINDMRFIKESFQWQSGFGAFSYSREHLDRMIRYVMNQKVHHQSRSFKEEYLGILKDHNIAFRNEYLFEFFDGDISPR